MKKLLAAALSGVLTAGIILGGTGLSTKAAETETETTGELTPIKVAASATPHAEILEQAKPILAEEGYDLQVTVFDDYIMPNEVVESGDMDANYFQHLPYLEQYNEEKGSHLVSVGGIHYEPLESTREQNPAWTISLTAIPLQFRMIPPMRQEPFCFFRITVSSN